MFLNDNMTQIYIPDINEKNIDKRELKVIRSINQNNIYELIMSYGFVFHTLFAEETYWSLAVDYYNNQDYWVYIFYVNKIFPSDLRPGDILLIPTMNKFT